MSERTQSIFWEGLLAERDAYHAALEQVTSRLAELIQRYRAKCDCRMEVKCRACSDQNAVDAARALLATDKALEQSPPVSPDPNRGRVVQCLLQEISIPLPWDCLTSKEKDRRNAIYDAVAADIAETQP